MRNTRSNDQIDGRGMVSYFARCIPTALGSRSIPVLQVSHLRVCLSCPCRRSDFVFRSSPSLRYGAKIRARSPYSVDEA